MTESLVVLVILGVLATVAGLGYRGWADTGNTAQCQDNLRAIRTQFKTYRIRMGRYPTSSEFSAFLGNTTYFPIRPRCPSAGNYVYGTPDATGVPTITCTRHGAP